MKERNSSRAFLAFAFIVAIGSSVILPILGLRGSRSIRSSGVVGYQPEVGIHYISRYGTFEESDDVLRRDFARFHRNGLSVIVLLVDWYRVENKFQRGDYDGNYTAESGLGNTPYGRGVLDGIKRFCRIAGEFNISVIVGLGTVWGADGGWAIPNYAVDPVTEKVQALAIVRDSDVRDGFIDMFTYFVGHLAGTPNIIAWHILGEPWYYPSVLPPPHEHIDQKENFITLFQNLSMIVEELDGRQVTIAFISHWWGENMTGTFNLFAHDWNWDQRIFEALDFISFSTSMNIPPELIEDWKSITRENVLNCTDRGKKVCLMGVGYSSNDDAGQADALRTSLEFLRTLPLEGLTAWCWWPDPPHVGRGHNLLKTMEGDPRPAYYELSNIAKY